jgi:membrane-bound metal-dependent hydrolase YbcI (DUF457 family)
MVEPIVHLVVPTGILLALFSRESRGLILLLSPLAVLPDLDFLLGHRYLLHNLLFVSVIPLILYLFSRRKMVAVFAFYLLGSHLLLDTFGPGVGFFYPFYDRLFRFDFYIYTSPAKGGVSYEAGTATVALIEATRDQLSPAVTSLGVVLLVLVAAGIAIQRWEKREKR